MITYEGCLALGDLTSETVERVAAREVLTPMAAIGLASSWAVPTKGKRSSRRTADDVSPEPTTRPAIMLHQVAPIRSGAERLAA